MAEPIDVLVVGAGPTGLMLGCWLARWGLRAMIVDPKAGPTPETRALGVQARTLETYDMLGIGERALAEGVPARGAAMWRHHKLVGRVVFGDMGRGVSPHPYMFIMGQDRTEALLLDDLRARGGDVRWGWAFAGLAQDERGVTASLSGPDGATETVRARWVCGCDGARSPVRHALGLPFEGGTYGQRFYVADVQATGPLREGELSLCVDEGRFQAFFPMPGPGHFRIVGIVPPALAAREDLRFADVQGEAEAHTGMRVEACSWFSTYHVHHRVAARFRVGRVFLLGDAGHVHSPVGGQGMNTGLMDASNLGWKLGMVARGEADARLLDSYEPERMPFARQLVETTDRVFSLVSGQAPLLGALRSWLLPTLFVTGTHLPVLRRELFGLISQTRLDYPASPLSFGQAGAVRGGDRLPWAPRPDGASNFDALKRLRPQLQVYGPLPDAVARFAARHPELPLVPLPDGPEVGRAGLQPGALYLVRPDGYVAYAAAELDPAHLEAYLAGHWGLRAPAAAR